MNKDVRVEEITPRELQSRLAQDPGLRIVDVRTPFEFRRSHIEGSINVPLSQVDAGLPLDGSSESVVFVCLSGSRSAMACRQILGKSKVVNLVGGIGAWRAAGFPLEKAPPSPRRLDRQTHLVAGLMLAAALLLANLVHHNWIYLAALPMFGLLLDATTGICPMTLMLKSMPWNRESQSACPKTAQA
ncbi:MAG: rhodanese-like domain-containing protein [Fimbriimonadaceae bacterium]|nr:rhodanese-like domain-containing protein [Fimbriimonadaceae bacterium]